MPIRSESTPLLTAAQRDDVLALVGRAATTDGSRALSEQSVLTLRATEPAGAVHLLRYAGDHLAGYAQLAEGSAELVVAPDHRRRGLASDLLAELPDDVKIWAHGDGEPAESFAAARGLAVVRELWVLGKSLDAPPALDEVALPEGLVARAFEPGRDEDEWVRVNAAAFAHHPEQGRMTRADLEARMSEPWFEAAGLILVVPTDDPDDPDKPDKIAAFHWTKVHSEATGSYGEVYVVGVDPAYQGRGLGRPVTLLGLHHLQEAGLADVILYVDGDNPAALKVYRGLGFTPRSVDRMYARPHDGVNQITQSSPEGGTMRS